MASIDDVAGLRMVFVAVGALDQERPAVDLDQAILDADVAEPDFEPRGFEGLAIRSAQGDIEVIQVGVSAVQESTPGRFSAK